MTRKRKKKRRKVLQGNPTAPAEKRVSDTALAEDTGSQQAQKRGKRKKKTVTEEHQKTLFDSVRENAEALIIAVILAIIIRHFAVEAFEIPTGSMAPTLFGMHVWQECPNCSFEFPVAVQSNSSTGQLVSQFPRRLVYHGPCHNSNCTIDLHSRAPTRQLGWDSRGIRDPAELARHFQRLEGLSTPGQEIQCLGCTTTFRGDEKNYRWSRAVDSPVRCPICHHSYVAVFDRSAIQGGHKILVNKFAYALGKPERWDVIVFEFDQWKNYIKRLIGLPGERVQIFDGDIYVNGKIERKPPDVQDAMWRMISHSDRTERGLNKKWPTPWEEVAVSGSGFWKAVKKPRRGQRWSLNNRDHEQPAMLEYTRGFNRYKSGFDNYISYNAFNVSFPPSERTEGRPEGVQVGDRKLVFSALPVSTGKNGWLGAQIRDGDYTFRLRIPVGTASESYPAVLERIENEPPRGPPVLSPPRHPDGLRKQCVYALPLQKSTTITLENVDDRIVVEVNGEEILSLTDADGYVSCPDLDAPPTPNGRLDHHLRILGADVQAEIGSIKVYLDFYYINWDLDSIGQRSRWKGIVLEEGQYLALGDNSPSSSDGRKWGFVPEKNLMGKATVIFWRGGWFGPPQWKFIR